LRPKFAAKPRAAPPIAAAMTGPAPSPHEKALRLPLPERLRLDDERLDFRFSVRVAIGSLLGWNRPVNVGEGAAFLLRSAFRPPLGALDQKLFDGCC
jgi:hypothetical protein